MRRLLLESAIEHASLGLSTKVKALAQEVVSRHTRSTASLQVRVSQNDFSVERYLALGRVQKIVDVVP